jgi:hypothetical protein
MPTSWALSLHCPVSAALPASLPCKGSGTKLLQFGSTTALFLSTANTMPAIRRPLTRPHADMPSKPWLQAYEGHRQPARNCIQHAQRTAARRPMAVVHVQPLQRSLAHACSTQPRCCASATTCPASNAQAHVQAPTGAPTTALPCPDSSRQLSARKSGAKPSAGAAALSRKLAGNSDGNTTTLGCASAAAGASPKSKAASKAATAGSTADAGASAGM